MDEDSKLRLVNPAPEPEDPDERFALALERLGDKAPQAGSLEWLNLLVAQLPPLAPDDPRLDLSKGLHVVTKDGFCLDRWPRDIRTPEQKAKDQAEWVVEARRRAAWLREALTGLLAKHVLRFCPKPSGSSTPPTHPNPSQET